MKSFLIMIGLVIVACLITACDSDPDTLGNNGDNVTAYGCVGNKADDPGCEPDITGSPPGEDIVVGVDTYIVDNDVWEPSADPCIPFQQYDGSCFNCGSGYICVQTTFILNEGMCGIQSSCFGLLYGDPNNPPPRFQDHLSYIKILASGDLEAYAYSDSNPDLITCPPCD